MAKKTADTRHLEDLVRLGTLAKNVLGPHHRITSLLRLEYRRVKGLQALAEATFQTERLDNAEAAVLDRAHEDQSLAAVAVANLS